MSAKTTPLETTAERAETMLAGDARSKEPLIENVDESRSQIGLSAKKVKEEPETLPKEKPATDQLNSAENQDSFSLTTGSGLPPAVNEPNAEAKVLAGNVRRLSKIKHDLMRSANDVNLSDFFSEGGGSRPGSRGIQNVNRICSFEEINMPDPFPQMEAKDILLQ